MPGALRSHTDGPVVTALVRLEDDSQLDPVRGIPGVRVNVFPLGLEEAFIDMLGPEISRDFWRWSHDDDSAIGRFAVC